MKTQNKYNLPCNKKDIIRVVSDPRAHSGKYKYAIDFALPKGSEVLAARDGIVRKIKQDSNEGGGDEKYKNNPSKYLNFIYIEHENKEYAKYAHIQHQSVKVEKGEKVKQGDVIALSGNTGYSSRPHLHFHVLSRVEEEFITLDIQFSNSPKIKNKIIEGEAVKVYQFDK